MPPRSWTAWRWRFVPFERLVQEEEEDADYDEDCLDDGPQPGVPFGLPQSSFFLRDAVRSVVPSVTWTSGDSSQTTYLNASNVLATSGTGG